MSDEKDPSVGRRHHHMLPVWFFIGVLLLVYGIIILTIGVREYAHPVPVVLSKYHANIWAGVVLILLGGGYTLRFFPRTHRRK
jgi:FtsH-binding integral membrane protein